MPTYEYECKNCGHSLEAFQSMTADPLKECPKCKKMKLQRLIGTGAGIIFKGSGFYETDYRSDSYKKAEKSEKSSSNSSSSSSSSSSKKSKESKTAKATSGE